MRHSAGFRMYSDAVFATPENQLVVALIVLQFSGRRRRGNVSVEKSVRHAYIMLYGGKDLRTRGRRVASFVKPCPVNNITSSRRKTHAAAQPLFYSHYRQRILKVII